MKERFLRVILFLSLCIPATALGQAVDTTEVEKPGSYSKTDVSRSTEQVSKSTEQTARSTEQISKQTEQAAVSRTTEVSKPTEQATFSKPAEIVVRIYPNPAVDKVTYTFPAGIQKHLLQVTDMAGRTILNSIVGNIGTQNTINTSAWRPGIYFVSINSSTFSKTFKLMKQ